MVFNGSRYKKPQIFSYEFVPFFSVTNPKPVLPNASEITSRKNNFNG
jgi:hypothetical protein